MSYYIPHSWYKFHPINEAFEGVSRPTSPGLAVHLRDEILRSDLTYERSRHGKRTVLNGLLGDTTKIQVVERLIGQTEDPDNPAKTYLLFSGDTELANLAGFCTLVAGTDIRNICARRSRMKKCPPEMVYPSDLCFAALGNDNVDALRDVYYRMKQMCEKRAAAIEPMKSPALVHSILEGVFGSPDIGNFSTGEKTRRPSDNCLYGV